MTAPGSETLTQLGRVIAAGRLPEEVTETAKKLHDRLSSPLRVTILGVPGVGKSRVLELLAGEPVVPEGVQVPVLKLVFGDESKTVVTTADGSTETLDGIDLTGAAELEPAMVEVQAPMPALKRITVMEVGIGLSRPEQARACGWAAKRTDLAIWCTRDFGAAEQAAWATMPEVIKGQAILLRTRIDQAPNPRAALDRVDRLGRDEFDRVLAINTTAALEARAGEEVDRKAFKASGGQALIAAVLKVVDRTRQAFIDQADLLLVRYADLVAAAMRPEADLLRSEFLQAAPPEEEYAPEFNMVLAAAAKVAETTSDEAGTDDGGTKEAEPDEATANEAVAAEEPVQAAAVDASEQSAEAAPETADTSKAEPVEAAVEENAPAVNAVALPRAVKASPGTRVAFEAAVARLKKTGADLVSGDAPPSGDSVLSRSVKDLTWLDEHLQMADGDDPALSWARDDVQEAVDMVQLMQIEQSDGAADDAAAIMLQLRRRLQQGLATV